MPWRLNYFEIIFWWKLTQPLELVITHQKIKLAALLEAFTQRDDLQQCKKKKSETNTLWFNVFRRERVSILLLFSPPFYSSIFYFRRRENQFHVDVVRRRRNSSSSAITDTGCLWLNVISCVSSPPDADACLASLNVNIGQNKEKFFLIFLFAKTDKKGHHEWMKKRGKKNHKLDNGCDRKK